MRPVLIVDTETTGLDPQRHEIWEAAVIDREAGVEHLWRVKPNLAVADPQALAIGRYYERTSGMRRVQRPAGVHDLVIDEDDDEGEWSAPADLAAHLARLLDGAVLVAANPAFDAGFLTAFLRDNGEAPTWHYRLRDIGSMAWGWLSAPGEWVTPAVDASTDDFARAMGIEPDAFERHSALGDCLLVAAMLDMIEGAR